jgi:hypothetical protein
MREIQLRGMHGVGLCVIVDDDDFEYLDTFKWHAKKDKRSGDIYPGRTKGCKKNSKTILLHRFIMGITDSNSIVDHINHNTLDCRKTNLRITDRKGNNQNRIPGIKPKGVYEKDGKYFASINGDKKQYTLGTFRTMREAIIAYNAACIVLHGDYAYLNPIDNS